MPLRGCAAGELALASGDCLPAGMQEGGCAAGELALDEGGCLPAGVPPELCGDGFSSDGDAGCEAILPPAPCEPGLFAVPGERECHEVAACGSGAWGDIPSAAGTQHVDASYGAGGSDGTAAKPWTTIAEAIEAARPGAVVAVAAGSYQVDVVVEGRSVVLWGRCPALVEIVGTGVEFAALTIRDADAAGTVVRGLAVRGAGVGVLIEHAPEVTVENLWIHDTSGRGLESLASADVTLRSLLVESATGIGVVLLGATATIDGVAVRDTASQSDGTMGWGLAVSYWSHASVTLRSSIFERNRGAAMAVIGAEAEIDSVLFRDTLAQADGAGVVGGAGVFASPDAEGTPARAVVRSSVVERATSAGIVTAGAEATLEGVVVRDTRPRAADQLYGRGMELIDDPVGRRRGDVRLRSCLVERNHEAGLMIGASDGVVEAVLVRDTLPQAANGRGGWGFGVVRGVTDQRANVWIGGSVSERNRELGVLVSGSDATLVGMLVRDTQPAEADQLGGRGVHVQSGPKPGQRANVAILSALLEGNFELGIAVLSSDALVQATIVRDTGASPGSGEYGDALATVSLYGPGVDAAVQLEGSRIERSARAGVSLFGANAAIEDSLFECNMLDLDSEPSEEAMGVFENRGGNVCGCAGAVSSCHLVTAGLTPPEQLPD